ncbi:MAG: hypothetical protein KY476_02890 [Planctomycetes bacterium]|nr:hypothetical protein [Planctomycetota bacterium]
MDQQQATGLSPFTERPFRWRDAFPWIRLWRAVRIAADLRKLLLAAAALAVVAAGERLFVELPFAPDGAEAAFRWPWQPYPGAYDGFDADSSLMENLTADWGELTRPLAQFLAPASHLMDGDGGVEEAAYAWTRLLWAIIVWSLFGGAIARMAAVEFARDERVALWAALRFAGGRFLSYLSAPLLPIAGVAALWLLCLVGGLLGRLPWVGEGVVGLFWFVPLAIGFVMALIVVGVALGWPLMSATISVEGTDAFDGFSRSYSYLYGRPGYFAWLVLVALVFGALAFLVVKLFATMTVFLAGWGVSDGMGLENLGVLVSTSIADLLDPDRLEKNTRGWINFGRPLAMFWIHVVVLLAIGYGAAFFWTAATALYLLLRYSEDAVELDEVHLEHEPERDDLLPLVGVAASDQPAGERPATAPGDLKEPPAEVLGGFSPAVEPAPPPADGPDPAARDTWNEDEASRPGSS